MKPYYEKLRELREGQDLKQSDVALVLGTTQQVYSRYENGINELPLRHLITLCGFYRVSADVSLGLMDEEAERLRIHRAENKRKTEFQK